MNNYYFSVDQYLEMANKAHAQYLIERYKASKQQHHPVDLAVESASFFEAFFISVEALTDVLQHRRLVETPKPTNKKGKETT